MMTPGTYLKLRREAAHLALSHLAIQLTGMPDRVRKIRASDQQLMLDRLMAAEADASPLTVVQAALLRRAFHFDITVYERLLKRFLEGHHSSEPASQICTGCGCSWHDACPTASGPCRWTSAETDRCSACADSAGRHHCVLEGIAA